MAIAGGQLDTRLPAATADPDLAGLTGSFNLMVDQLQERIEREARFTSDVSHELRSPLTTLAASLEVLEARADELPATAQRALVLLGADLRRFQRMVGDLLEISRSDTGSADVFLEEVTAGELVRRSVAANARSLPGGVAPPEVAIDPVVSEAWLNVDKRRFERVMANLLENAALYGGGATVVRAEPGPVRPDGRATIRVSVEDGGSGLAPTERSKVFERFYRGQASGQRGAGTGTGLGLALVAEHVRLNGGTVWADEADGGGARFTLELPVEEERMALIGRARDRVRPRRLTWPVLALAVMAAVTAACGVPTGGGPQAIPQSQVPSGLLSPVVPTTTTPSTAAGAPVRVYFLDTAERYLTPRPRNVGPNATLTTILDVLLQGPYADEEEAGVRTAIPSGVQLLHTTVVGKLVTANFNEAFGLISGTQQVLAVAQVVYTVTAWANAAVPVQFEIEGSVVQVPNASGAEVSGPCRRRTTPP